MNNIIAFLTTQHLDKGPLISKANKLVLEGGRNLHIYSIASISTLRKKGYTEVDSLDKIAETLEKFDRKNLNDQESKTLLENYRWIYRKIESHNRKIEEKTSLRFLHNIIKFFSRGKHGLKYEHTLEPQIRDIQKHLDNKKTAEALLTHWANRIDPPPSSEELKTALLDFAGKYDLTEMTISNFVSLLPDLTPENRESVIGALSQTNKTAIFRELPLFTKMTIFRELSSPAAKAALFIEFEEKQRISIFNPLSIEEKMEILSQLSDDQKIKGLLIADDLFLKHYFDQTPFLEEYKLQGLTIDQAKQQITSDQKQVLVRLLQLKHNPTVLEIQNFPLLRALVRDELEKYLVRGGAQPGESALLEALNAIDQPQSFIPHENLLQILIFIRENHDLMAVGAIGRKGTMKPGKRKIKATEFKVPVNLEYTPYTPGGDNVVIKLGILGKGHFKIVKHELYLSQLGLEFPRHAISKQPENELARNEVNMMEVANGLPNVIALFHTRTYRSYKTGQFRLVLDTPAYNAGELNDWMKSTSITQIEKLRVAAGMLRGVVGLHSRGIIHRDIKPANIFLHKMVENGKEVVRAIVGDLGLACSYGDHLRRHNLAGSPLYIPPEVLSGKTYVDYSSDAWALGLTLSELFTGSAPFTSAKTNDDVYRAGLAFEAKPRPLDINSIEYVIWKLLRPNPAERMTVQEALRIVEGLLVRAENNPKISVS